MPPRAKLWFDPLQIFAISIALCLAAFLFLVSAMANVSLETAATRAIVGWAVLSALGIALTMLVRWILAAPRPTR
jgi:uncharacterized YccA/Bax inhibitor family protein